MGQDFVLVKENGSYTRIGSISGFDLIQTDISFDYLGIVANNEMYLFDGVTLIAVTDPDLGNCKSLIWVDGYWMSTDGEYIVVTELDDPFSVSPTKYGSSELDPDPVLKLLKVRNEPHAINRYTIEVFNNVGSTGFPFQRNEGAQIQKGAISKDAACLFNDAIAFLGSGKNESLSIYLASNGTSVKIATTEIEKILQEYTEPELSDAVLEPLYIDGHEILLIHLKNKTLAYDTAATRAAKVHVWYFLTDTIIDEGAYNTRNFVHCYNKYIVGNAINASIGTITLNTGDRWGNDIGWEFDTGIVYNESNGALFHEIELVALTGNTLAGENPTIWTSYTLDGQKWSQERGIKAGKTGKTEKRLVWIQQGNMRNWRVQKFRGATNAFISPVRINADIEGLVW